MKNRRIILFGHGFCDRKGTVVPQLDESLVEKLLAIDSSAEVVYAPIPID